MDEPINFTYEDTDRFQNEISELYSYSEESDFFANRNAFEESMEDCGLPLAWKHMALEQQSRAINYLMSTLEVSCRATRIKSCRALAYLIQGNFGECLSLEEQSKYSQENVFLLYQQGIFQAFVQQLHIESNLNLNGSNSQPSEKLPSSPSFTDSSELRIVLAVLCTITETMYHAKDNIDSKIQDLRQQFIDEVQTPVGDELLTITLFQMLNNCCSGLAPHYPIRKISLLLWKLILITLGGTKDLKKLKEDRRKQANLEPTPDDTLEVIKTMFPCSPPIMPDGQSRVGAVMAGKMMANKRKVFKQTAFDDAVFAYAKECFLNSLSDLNQTEEEQGSNQSSDSQVNARSSREYRDSCSEMLEGSSAESSITLREKTDDNNDGMQNESNPDDDIDLCNLDDGIPIALSDEKVQSDESSDSGISTDNEKQTNYNIDDLLDTKFLDMPENSDKSNNEPANSIPQASSSDLKPGTSESRCDGSRSDVSLIYKGLPWAPKVRKADLNQHLSNIRLKFLGYTLNDDLETTFGLPDPIIEGINVLKKHLYVSLAEVQLQREETIEKYPLTHGEINPNYQEEAAEKLYTALLPRLPQYMIALLKILLAASTSTVNKSERGESINIMSEINSDRPQSIVQTMKTTADVNRQKEIIIKAISAILILLLKHFKLNHAYQFEYVSQQLMFANCIPLILKFLSQDIYAYIVTSRTNISAIDFPACVIGEQPELTTEIIEMYCSFQQYSWRNMFSCINLVRVLNKLTKWKHSRIMMLVVFKSSQTLLTALSVRQTMFQLYVLKLLKVQLKFLGRQWKKNNMKLIGPIYQKVRHRLTDDWAYSNDNEAKPWDFQAEEFSLQANINRFHQRRYHQLLAPNSKPRNGFLFNQTDKFSGYDDCTIDDEHSLNEMIQISPNFMRNYERWLESEVFQRRIDWDKLLDS